MKTTRTEAQTDCCGGQTMILTREDGTPFEKPERENFPDVYEYWRAVYAYRDAVAAEAYRSFDKAFRKALKEKR